MNTPPLSSAARIQRRLFLASFITLIAAGIGFSIRSGILDDWGRQFGFTQTELGAITGSGLWGFGLAVVFFSVIADRVGYGRLMMVAFLLHVLAALATLGATFAFASYGKAISVLSADHRSGRRENGRGDGQDGGRTERFG